MASEETVNIEHAEPVINRWLVDFYLFLAIDLFEKKQYKDFCAIRALFDRVLSRPLESSETTPTKIRVVQFLGFIKDGESLDLVSDEDPALSPLESALKLLQTMKEDCPLQMDYVQLSSSLKEMIVRIFIMKGEFDRAKKALRHFPKSMADKKAIFMGLINQRVQNIVDPMEFIKFREEMLGFCQKLCQFTTPFLLKAAVRLIGSRHTDAHDNTEEPEQLEEPKEHSGSKPCNRVFIAKSRLEAGFNVLADETNFFSLEKDMEEEEPSTTQGNEEKDQLYLRNSGSPLEASPADKPAQMSDIPQAQTSSYWKTPANKRPYTVARLVMEQDTPTGSPEMDPELTQKKILEISENMDITQSPLMECEVSKPIRKLKSCGRAKATSSAEEDNSDADETNTSSKAENETVLVVGGLDQSPIPVLKDGPQTSSTPHRVKSSPHTQWKLAFNSAKESKEVWSDEDVPCDGGSPNESLISNYSQRKRKWTDSETQRLKEGVEKFGEGNWSKIKAYYRFKERTNVNLKDRWRTMKKLKLV